MRANDEVLKQVEAALREIPDVHRPALHIELSDGILTVQGEVPDVARKKLALAAAAVPGVRDIIDRLHVVPGERAGDGPIRDAVCELLLRNVDFRSCTIRTRVRARLETLRQAPGDSCGAIEIAVGDGIVTLTGQVISLSHKRLAGAMAWWIAGCRDVVNRLEVVPPEEDNDDEISDALRLVLETDPLVPAADQIGIRTRNHTVTLGGVVATEEEKKRAELDAWSLYAVNKVINHIEVRL